MKENVKLEIKLPNIPDVELVAIESLQIMGRHFGISEDIIKPFQFVVESSTNPGKPLVFSLDESLLQIGLNGRKAVRLVDTDLFSETPGQEVTIAYEILGVNQLIEKFKYHSENGFFLEKEIQEAGVNPLTISWEGFVETQNTTAEWN